MRSVLRSKLRPPRLGAGRLIRPRLFALLDRGLAAQFTLISAPAGYGKTTLLAQWVQCQDMPTVWLSLEEGDDDPGFFLQALILALKTISPDCCQGLQSLLARVELPPAELLAQQFGNDLEDVDEFILVLDDCHNLKDPRILEIFRSLIYQPPRSLHLVLSCRADPMLPLGALRGRGLLNEVRAADLRFNREEALEYLRQTPGLALNESQVDPLLERTEGWIAGLHLAALSLLGREDLDEGIRRFAGSDRYVADYLIEELLGRLDPALQRYLTATSILERLCAPLCKAVMGEENIDSVEGRPVLEWLEESNLFVVSLDGQREWFRYHNLFRDLLRHRLHTARSPEEVAALHIAAGEWLGGTGAIDQALEHFTNARRPDLAADLIEHHRREAIDEERWRAVTRWVGKVDPEIVDTRPGLILVHAWLAHEKADWAEVVGHCDRAEELLDLHPEPPQADQVFRGEIAAMRSQASYWRGEAEAALSYAREALARLPHEYRYPSAVATVFEGGALQMMGDSEAAFEVFRRASMQDYGKHPDTRLMVGVALAAFVAGQLDYPRQMAERLLSDAVDLELEDSIGYAHFLLGLAAYLRNDLSTAEDHFKIVQPHASNLLSAKQSAYGLAWIRQSQNRLDEALESMDRFSAIASNLTASLEPEIRLLKARLAALSGRPAVDLTLARSFLPSPDNPPAGLDVCYEFSPISAVALLLLAGREDDVPACEQAVQCLLSAAEAQHNVFRSIQCLILQALVFDRQGRAEEALDSLGRGVRLAEPGCLVRLFPEMSQRVLPLLQALGAPGTAGAFIDEIAASFAGGPLSAPASANHWTGPTQGSAVGTVLTNRELDVLELLAQRLSNKEIARQLVISPATVKRHTLSIYGKLGVPGRREAVVKARHLGLLPSAW